LKFQSSCLSLLSARIAGVYYCAWLLVIASNLLKVIFFVFVFLCLSKVGEGVFF
jgi:hypothetical protein